MTSPVATVEDGPYASRGVSCGEDDDDDGRAIDVYLYAFEQCGFIVADANRHLFDDDDLAAWDRAIAEATQER